MCETSDDQFDLPFETMPSKTVKKKSQKEKPKSCRATQNLSQVAKVSCIAL